MAVMTTETPQVVSAPRRPWLTLLAAVLCTVPYAGLVVPYLANGLHHRPAGTPLQAYDLGAMWPFTTAVGGLLGFGVLLVPFAATAVVVWSGVDLWSSRRSLTGGQVAVYVTAALVAFGCLAWFATPLGGGLVVWMLD